MSQIKPFARQLLPIYFPVPYMGTNLYPYGTITQKSKCRITKKGFSLPKVPKIPVIVPECNLE